MQSKWSHVLGIIIGIVVGAAFVAKAEIAFEKSKKCYLFVEKGVDGRPDNLDVEGEAGTRFILRKD